MNILDGFILAFGFQSVISWLPCFWPVVGQKSAGGTAVPLMAARRGRLRAREQVQLSAPTGLLPPARPYLLSAPPFLMAHSDVNLSVDRTSGTTDEVRVSEVLTLNITA